MPDYLIRPKSVVDADANDATGAILALGRTDPATISGLANGTAYYAQEVLLSPVSAAFTPAVPSAGITILGWSAGTAIDLTALSAIGSASGTGDGAALAEGDLLVAFPAYADSSKDRTLAITDAGWTEQIRQENNAAVTDTEMGVFTKVMGATPDTAVNMTYPGASTAAYSMIVVALRGVNASPLTGVAAGVADRDAPSITTAHDGALIFAWGAMGSQDNATLAQPAGMTAVGVVDADDTHDVSIAVACHEQASAGAYDPATFTVADGTENSSVAGTIAFRPA